MRQAESAIGRRNFVLREMWENGYITRSEMQDAQKKPLLTVQSGHYSPFRASLPPRDYFTDEIRRQLTRDFGEEEFFTQGFTVRATVDADMQDTAATALRRALEKYDRAQGKWRGTGKSIPAEALASEGDWRAALSKVKVARDVDLGGRWHAAVVLDVADQTLTLGAEGVQDTLSVPRDDIQWISGNFFDNFEPGDVVHVRRGTNEDGDATGWSLRQVPEVQGGFMAMDVNTGRVIAMQGGFSYQHSVFNRATQATRQPGSSFKPFVYAAALDSGYQPMTIVVDAPIEIDQGNGEIWRPKNASNKFYGPSPLRTGIERSRNLMTVRLAQDVGMNVIARYAERFGVYDEMDELLANSLGSQETTLFKMVSAYAMFANGGERVEPTLVDRIQDRYGKTVFKHDMRSCNECVQFASLDAGLGPRDRLQPGAGDGPDHGLSADVDDDRRGGAGDGRAVGQPAGTDCRQDRNHQRFQRRMVCRLFVKYRRGLLYRLRPAPQHGSGRVGRRHVRSGVSGVHDRSDRGIRRRSVRGSAGRAFRQDRPFLRRAAFAKRERRACRGRICPRRRGSVSGHRQRRDHRRRLCDSRGPAVVRARRRRQCRGQRIERGPDLDRTDRGRARAGIVRIALFGRPLLGRARNRGRLAPHRGRV